VSSLYDGEEEEVAELVRKALDRGMEPGKILSGGLISGMDQVGRDFKAGDLRGVLSPKTLSHLLQLNLAKVRRKPQTQKAPC